MIEDPIPRPIAPRKEASAAGTPSLTGQIERSNPTIFKMIDGARSFLKHRKREPRKTAPHTTRVTIPAIIPANHVFPVFMGSPGIL